MIKTEMLLQELTQFKTKPYPYQFDAFEQCKDEEFFALFMDMGTGKSKITIDIATYKYLKGYTEAVMIIAPNNVHTQWIQEQFPTHCPIKYKPFTWSSKKTSTVYYRNALEDFMVGDFKCMKVFAVNVEAFQSSSIIKTIAEYVRNHNTFIVVDEATRIKTPTAQRSKTIHRLSKYGHRCILTGTPTAKSPFDLWSQFEFLKSNFFECKYFVFQHRYGVLMRGENERSGKMYTTLIDERRFNEVRSRIKKIKEQRGGKLMPDDYETISTIHDVTERNVHFIENHAKFTKYKKIDKLREIIKPYVFAIKKEDCLDLPPKVYETLLVDLPPEQRRIYDNLKKLLLAEYEGQELTVLNKVALTTRLMQVTGGFFPYTEEIELPNGKIVVNNKTREIGKTNIKIKKLSEDVAEVGDTKVIVWAHFVSELKLLYKELSKNYTCALYYGAVSQDDRQQIVEDFKLGRYDIFIGNTQTAGFGLNLQNATMQYYYSNSFRTEDRLQAEDRSHRIGVKGTCVYKDIVAKNTLDQKIVNSIKEGRDLNDFFKSQTLNQLFEPLEGEEV